MKTLTNTLISGRLFLAGLISLFCPCIFNAGAGDCPFVILSPGAQIAGSDNFFGTLPTGYIGTYYSLQITGSGPFAYTFAVPDGGLPTGLYVDSNSGLLYGTPTATGLFTFTVFATYNGSCTETVTYNMTIEAAGPYSTTYVGNNNLLFSGQIDEIPTPGGSPHLVIMGEYGSPNPSGSAIPATTFPPWGGWITDVQIAGGNEPPNFTLYVLAPVGPGPNSGEQQFKVVAASENIQGNIGFSTEGRELQVTPPLPTGPGDLLAFVGVGPNYNSPGDCGAYRSPFNVPPEPGYSDATYQDAVQGGGVLVTPPTVGETITVAPSPDPMATYVYSGASPGRYALGVDVAAALTTSSTAAPGQSASVDGFEANATLQNSGSGSETLTETAYPSNPNGTAADFTGAGGYVDLSVSPQTTPGDGDTLTVTFYFPAASQLATAPELFYFPNGGTTPELVLDQTGNPVIGTYVSSVGGYATGGYTFSVTLNDGPANITYPNTPPSTTPTISQLTGTLFAMGTLRALNVVAPPSAIAGQTASVTVTTSDGSSPYVTITGSDSKGVYPGFVELSGGTATFNVTFKTTGQQTVTASTDGYSPGTSSGVIVDCPGVRVAPYSNTTLSGTVGNPFYLPIPVIGGSQPYTFTVTSGTLPAGLVLGTSGTDTFDEGLLSGTPTTPVTSAMFTITARDADGCVASITYTMTVSAPTAAAPTANSQSFATHDSPGAHVTLTGSDPNSLPLTYTVAVNTANGGELGGDDPGWTSSSVINGVLSIQWAKANSASSVAPMLTYIPPDHTGPDHFTFTVYNGSADSPPATVSISVVASGQPLNTTLTPQSGLGGVTASLSGSAPGHTAVTAVAYAANPNGTAAAFTGTASYVDLAVLPQTTLGDGDTLTATFFLPAASELATAPQLYYFPNGSSTPESVLDDNGNPIIGSYSSPDGGYNFTVTFNDLTPAAPTGMGTTPTISQLTGTVFAMGTLAPAPPPGTYLQVLATPTEATAGTTPVAVTINALDESDNPVNLSDQVTINSSDLSAIFQATSLSQAFGLPQTVTLVNGTATFDVTFEQVGPQTVTATDANLASPTASSPSVTVSCPDITLSPTTAALTGTLNVPYSLQVTAAGSVLSYTYQIASGALPAGFTLNPTTGVISGTPSAPGASTFTVAAIDANGCSGSMTYTLTVPPPVSSQAVGNNLGDSYSGPDGDPPLVILGEYAPDGMGGPQAGSSFTLVNGTITDVKFLTTMGENYNFTLYVLQPGVSPGPGEQSFQIMASASVSGTAESSGLQTVTLTPPLPVSTGELLAFLGVGPDYNSSDEVGSDATYEDAGSSGFTATQPEGDTFTVGEDGDANTRYDYIPDSFGNQGRTYAIGVDVSVSGVPTQLQVLLPGESAAPGTLTGKTGAPTSQEAATPVNVTVNAVDANFNLVNTATPTVAITSSDPKAAFPAKVALSGGTATFSATFYTTGQQTVTANDTAASNPLESGTSSGVTIGAPALFLETVPPGVTFVPGSPNTTGSPQAQTAGVQFPITVYALDASYNIVNSSAPTVAIYSSDPNAILPANAALVNGMGTFNVTFKTAGTQDLAPIDVASALDGISDGLIQVNAGTAQQLQVLLPGESPAPGTATGETGAPSAQITGTTVNVTVNAVDAYFNTDPTASPTVAIGSSDPSAALPDNQALSAGTATFSVIFNTTGQQTVTASDTAASNPLQSGTSSGITLTGPASFLNIVPPGIIFVPGSPFESGSAQAQTAGVPFPITVYALDNDENIVTLETPTVAIFSSDPNAILPPNAALVDGVGTFDVTFKTAGNQTLYAMDTTGPLDEDIFGGIPVNPGSPTQLQVLLPGENPAPGTGTGKTGTPYPQVAGTPLNVAVNAVDPYFNPVPSVTPTVAVTSSDSGATLPGNQTLVGGTGTLSVTFNTPGEQTVTASDTASINPLASGVSTSVPVNVLGTPAYNSLAINSSQSTITLMFTGLPGATYDILAAPTVTGPWTDVSGDMTAASNGSIQYLDTINPGSTATFYIAEYISGP